MMGVVWQLLALQAASAGHALRSQFSLTRQRNATAADINSTRLSSEGHAHMEIEKRPQCACKADDAAWPVPTRTVPKCIFIDLGAAHGNTFEEFLKGSYGQVAGCPSGGQWEAYLVEANPHFEEPLEELQRQYPGQVHALPATAAYMCEGTTSFFIDTDPEHNHWGSSMSNSAPDVVRAGKVKVTVPTINVPQLVVQSAIPGDKVILKVDVEGAEYDIVPCLAKSPRANLVDVMYLEEHTWFDSGSQNSAATMANSKGALRQKGVEIPDYHSPTL